MQCVKVGRTHPEVSLTRLAIRRIDMTNQMSHDGLQVRVVFTRIVPAFARREVNLQRVLAGSPVLEPSGVGKDVPRRNQIEARIGLKKSNRRVMGHGRIEIERSLLVQLHDCGGENGLAHGPGFEDRVVIDRVLDAKSLTPKAPAKTACHQR